MWADSSRRWGWINRLKSAAKIKRKTSALHCVLHNHAAPIHYPLTAHTGQIIRTKSAVLSSTLPAVKLKQAARAGSDICYSVHLRRVCGCSRPLFQHASAQWNFCNSNRIRPAPSHDSGENTKPSQTEQPHPLPTKNINMWPAKINHNCSSL